MKNILVFIAAIIALTSCKPILIYDLSLSSVNRPEDVTKPFGDKKVVSFESSDKPVYTYEDENIYITWLFLQTQLGFVITNKSDNSIKLIWDNMKYVNYNGESCGIIHKGVFMYEMRNVFQVSTVVPVGATYEDALFPVDFGHYTGGMNEWKPGSLFPQESIYEKNIKSYKRACESLRVNVLFPIMIEGVENEYIFQFKINDVFSNRKK